MNMPVLKAIGFDKTNAVEAINKKQRAIEVAQREICERQQAIRDLESDVAVWWCAIHELELTPDPKTEAKKTK